MTMLLVAMVCAAGDSKSLFAEQGFATLEVSSNLPKWKQYTFGPDNLKDGKLGTSWQPKKKGAVGEFIKVTFAGEAEVESLVISNGFQLEDALGDLFSLNGRLKNLRVTFSDGATETCTFEEEKRGETVCSFSPHVTSSLQLDVVESYPGKKWGEVAVSELDIRGTVKKRTPPEKKKIVRDWKESDFYGSWQYSDGTGYDLWKNGKGRYEGPRGGIISWYIAGDTIVIDQFTKFEIFDSNNIGEMFRRKKN